MGNVLSDITYLISWGDGKGVTVYGFLIAVAILLGAGFGWLLSRKKGYPADTVIDMLIWCVPLAIIGARLYFIIFTAIGEGKSWTAGEMLSIWDGGLAVYGGVLFSILGCFLLSVYYKKRKQPDRGAVNAKIEGLELKIAGVQAEIDGISGGEGETRQEAAALAARKRKLQREAASLADSLKPKPPFFSMADLGAPFLILGQAVGRIGCYFSECCYGNPVTSPSWQWFPFAVQIGGEWHLATFFFESAWCLIGLAAMLYFSLSKERRWKFTGFVFAFYLMFYGLGRFILEFLRTENSETLWIIQDKLPASMAVAAVMFVWGLFIMLRAYLFKKPDTALKAALKEESAGRGA